MFHCAICDSAEGELWLEDIPDYEYPLPFRTTLIRCSSCAAVQQYPLPAADELKKFYPSDYHAYHYRSTLLSDWLKSRYSRAVGRRIRREIPDRGRILDLGCADGSFLAALEPLASWELHGIDLNPEVVRRPRSPKLHLRVGQLGRETYPPRTFDAIVAIHLIEHVTDPLETLRVCHTILKPGGIVVGELPNLDSWDCRLFGRYWGGLHLPRHLFFWSQAQFRDLGRRAGFPSVDTYPVLQPAHWAISLQNLAVSRVRMRRWLRRGRLPLYPLAVLASVPVNALQNWFQKPSITGFLFRKAKA